MGRGHFDVTAYEKQAKEAQRSTNSGFTATAMCDEFNPAPVKTRFSKRGPFNEFRDVITVLIGLDVTGSMDVIPKSLLEGKLGTLMVDLKKTFNRPNENLQISFAGIGDAKCDNAPLQVTHFESDNRFAQQLQKIWLEGGGGGNGGESYHLLWWYAANKTHLNYVKQDGCKGILITIGDDNVHPELTASEIQAWLEPTYDGKNVSNEVLLTAVKTQYEVYHIVVTDGSSYTYDHLTKKNKSEKRQAEDAEKWARLLGKNNIIYAKSSTVADAIATIVIRHRPPQKEGMANLPEQEWSKKNKENLTDEQWVEVLSYTLCPLTRHYMNDPTTLGDGKRAFEKQAIEDYLRTQKTDPLTGNKLTASELILKPNINIAQLCVDYKSFFDVLPPDRKERLIHLTLQEILPTQPKVSEARGVYPHPVFASKGSEVSGKAPEKSPSVESKALDKMVEGLICPLTLEIMEDPVILVETGQSYSKAALVRWLAQKDTDPISNNKLTDKTIRDNHVLKSLCDAARAAKSAQPGTPKP